MKKTLTCLCVAGLVSVLSFAPVLADAVKTGYVSYSQPTATNVAQVIFPSDPTKTIRLVCLDVLGGTAGATLSVLGGTTTTTLAYTNGLVTNLVVASTSGFVSNDVVVVQGTNDYLWQGTVWGTNGGTNLYFTTPATNGFPTNAFVYRMGDVQGPTIVSNSTVRISAESIYSAGRRKPLAVRVSGNGSLINWATVKYDPNN